MYVCNCIARRSRRRFYTQASRGEAGRPNDSRVGGVAGGGGLIGLVVGFARSGFGLVGWLVDLIPADPICR